MLHTSVYKKTIHISGIVALAHPSVPESGAGRVVPVHKAEPVTGCC